MNSDYTVFNSTLYPFITSHRPTCLKTTVKIYSKILPLYTERSLLLLDQIVKTEAYVN